MASSDNLTGIEPWMFRPSMPDTWLADYIARDADTLTKALHKTLSTSPEDAFSPFLNLAKTDSALTATPTVSSLSGSDQDSAPKRQRLTAAAAGKISKRKSRASKRSLTTFITADPANFREMVQQVTGARFGVGSNFPMAPIVKPEPLRMVSGGGRFSAEGCLPTLDTSAFLLDHNRQQQQHQHQHQPHQTMVGPNSDGPGSNSGPGPFSFGQPIGGLDDDAGFVSAGLDFETFSSCFPTLESSWKVM